MELIGREYEKGALAKFEKSGKPEFIAVYGRRRVGKTFLVKNFFKDRICFSASGAYDIPRKAQLDNFSLEISSRTGKRPARPKDWTEAFWQLEQYIISLPKRKSRKVIFLDELPWFDTQKSGFIRALDYFWNHFLSAREDCMLVVCGSATSWMVDNLINDKGGLHNRVTHEIHLRPFTLGEEELYLKDNGFKWSRLQVLQTYMIFGGIPYYLDMLDKDETFPTNIDRLMFYENAPLRGEFKRLYDSLFGRSDKYRMVIGLLNANKSGMTRKEISGKLNLTSGGNLTEVLDNLVNCDFVRYVRCGCKRPTGSSGKYQLIDFFTIFHFSFMAGGSTASNYWTAMMKSQKISTWHGLAFERVCMSHIVQIKQALHIDTILTESFSWQGNVSGRKSQIDMVIERADGMTNVCEMKYDTQGEYAISEDEEDKLRRRVKSYQEQSGTRNGIALTLVTTFGLKRNVHSGIIDNVVTMDSLFSPVRPLP